jgi:hypothetical protein
MVEQFVASDPMETWPVETDGALAVKTGELLDAFSDTRG